jgi:hypothetical protein
MLYIHSYTLLVFWGFRVMCNYVNVRLLFHLARLTWSWEGSWVAKRLTFSLRCWRPSLALLWFAPMNLMILIFLHMPLASHCSYPWSFFTWHLLIFSNNHTMLLVPLLVNMAKVNNVVKFLASEALIWNSQIHNFVLIVNGPNTFNLLGKLKMLSPKKRKYFFHCIPNIKHIETNVYCKSFIETKICFKYYFFIKILTYT